VAGGARARALAAAAALAGAAAGGSGALGACGSAAEPMFAAACGPDPTMERVVCTVRNNGTAAGNACFTARAQPETGLPLIARRVCTAVLAPGQAVEVVPPFEQIERVRRANTLASRCLRLGRWTCRVDIVETPREMAGQREP
jgi:hypothetical protein